MCLMEVRKRHNSCVRTLQTPEKHLMTQRFTTWWFDVDVDEPHLMLRLDYACELGCDYSCCIDHCCVYYTGCLTREVLWRCIHPPVMTWRLVIWALMRQWLLWAPSWVCLYGRSQISAMRWSSIQWTWHSSHWLIFVINVKNLSVYSTV